MGSNLSYEVKETQLDLKTLKGSIQGLQYSSQSRRYAGIRYALPPTGEHRWRKPRPIPETYSYSNPDGTPFNGTEFGSVCPQPSFGSKAESGDKHDFNEDCLRLNIWTPVPGPGNEGGNWPVMLWLHGGWFQMGDPSQEVGMDPTELISTGKLNAVFVSIGYRLNIFGFLAGDALEEESGNGCVGNYGLWDQRIAMEFVRDHITDFGGDPNNITLAGRSAGSYGVHAQILHDFRRPLQLDSENQLFHRVFMCSNAIPSQPRPLKESQPQFNEVCKYFKIACDLKGTEKLALLRKIDAKELVAAIKHFENHTFRPITDRDFIHEGMVDFHNNGSFAASFKERSLKLLIGEMLNEESLYAIYNPPSPNADSLRLQVGNYYGPTTADRVLPYYPLPVTSGKKEWERLYGTIIADGQVRAPSRFLVNNLVKHGIGVEDIWRYQIGYRLSFIDEGVAPRDFGCTHAMDKPFWNYSIMHGPTPAEFLLMTDWVKDLVAFVNHEKGYEYGTTEVDDMKVATPEGRIEIQKDSRWKELLDLADIFSGS